jgi:elongation factor 3
MRDGRIQASGHNWVEGQGSGPRIDKKAGEEDDQYDAMGNKIDTTKQKKLTSSDARKVCPCNFFDAARFLTTLQLKKDRLARKKRGEDIDDL